MGMLTKIRRMHFRNKLSVREVARRTGLSRNTIRNGFRQETIAEPKYPARTMLSIVDPYRDQLDASLRSDRHLPKRDQRTVRVIFEMLCRHKAIPAGMAASWRIHAIDTRETISRYNDRLLCRCS